jgi:hypothetical protein
MRFFVSRPNLHVAGDNGIFNETVPLSAIEIATPYSTVYTFYAKYNNYPDVATELVEVAADAYGSGGRLSHTRGQFPGKSLHTSVHLQGVRCTELTVLYFVAAGALGGLYMRLFCIDATSGSPVRAPQFRRPYCMYWVSTSRLGVSYALWFALRRLCTRRLGLLRARHQRCVKHARVRSSNRATARV